MPLMLLRIPLMFLRINPMVLDIIPMVLRMPATREVRSGMRLSRYWMEGADIRYAATRPTRKRCRKPGTLLGVCSAMSGTDRA
eukprot:99682-Rhodomonas_salina.4